MKIYSEILHDLSANNIQFDRWYTIDNYFYFVVKGLDINNYLERGKALIDQLSKLFVDCDLFKSYNTFCIDMNKQVGTINTYKEPSKKIKERIKESDYHFEL